MPSATCCRPAAVGAQYPAISPIPLRSGTTTIAGVLTEHGGALNRCSARRSLAECRIRTGGKRETTPPAGEGIRSIPVDLERAHDGSRGEVREKMGAPVAWAFGTAVGDSCHKSHIQLHLWQQYEHSGGLVRKRGTAAAEPCATNSERKFRWFPRLMNPNLSGQRPGVPVHNSTFLLRSSLAIRWSALSALARSCLESDRVR